MWSHFDVVLDDMEVEQSQRAQCRPNGSNASWVATGFYIATL